MRRALKFMAIVAGAMVPACQGQGLFDQADFKRAELGGIHLYGVSVFSGYSTSAYPLGLGQFVPPGLPNLGADANYGGKATLGWQHYRDRTNVSMMYSGTYHGMGRYSALNAFGQSLSLSASRRLGRRWTASLSASGEDSTLSQFLFQAATLSVVSQLPATFDDFAAALSVGQFSNDQIASLLTGAPVLESPARSLLLGDRILSYSAQASLSYAHSPRLSFRFGSLAAGGQHRADRQNIAAQQYYAMPRSIGANAGMGVSYSLSPRTQLGFNLEEQHQVNRYQNSYGTTATASFGRKMGQRWLVRMYGGATFTQSVRQIYGTPDTRQAVGGATLGFRTYQHTFAGSYDRSSFNAYGFAAGMNTRIGGSWNWSRPGRRWSVLTSFAEERMESSGFLSVSGWRASAGFSERLNDRTVVTAQYAYLSSSGSYVGNANQFALHSIRVSLSWTPEPRLR